MKKLLTFCFRKNSQVDPDFLWQSRKLDYFMKELVRSSYLETEMISVNIQKEWLKNMLAKLYVEGY